MFRNVPVTVLSVVCCKIWLLALEGGRLKVVESLVLRKVHETGENCVMRSVMIGTAHQMLFGWANNGE
jgi:hypothetical protein